MAKTNVYFNYSGCYDPTAGTAIAKVTRGEKPKVKHKPKRRKKSFVSS